MWQSGKQEKISFLDPFGATERSAFPYLARAGQHDRAMFLAGALQVGRDPTGQIIGFVP
ncbi:MAG: hypothetical protein HY740_04545 [Chloroflexi bacterium]|nr:hypothetical protein [Chloroflexota bacterium]